MQPYYTYVSRLRLSEPSNRDIFVAAMRYFNSTGIEFPAAENKPA